MTKYRLISKLFIATLIVAMISCASGSINPKESEEVGENLPDDIVEMRADQQKLAGIEMGLVELRSLSATLKVNGLVSVSPQNLATVCMPMGGFVKSTSLLPGSSVSKGQTLAIMENQDFVDVQQNYLEAKNRLEFSRTEFERHNELYKNEVYSQKSVQEVTANYRSLLAQVKALEQKLLLIGINPSDLQESNISRTLAIVSPINGYIKSVKVNLGKYVSPSDVLFEIVNKEKLLLELTLFEKDAVKVSEGQRIRFFINNESEQHEAVVYQTGKVINDDKTYQVFAKVISTCKNVLPGMYVNAVIETSGNQVASLPSGAIVSFDDVDYIFVYEKEKVEDGNPFTEYRMIRVQKGVTDGGYTEIILPEDFDIKTVKIVIKGAYNLLSAKKNAGEMAC